MFRSKLKILGRRLHDESGQNMIETAFCATVFVLFMFGTINFGYLYYGKVTLQNAVRQAARYAITGNCSSGNCFTNNSGNRLDTIEQTVTNYSFNLNPTVSVTCIQGSCPGYAGDGNGNNGGGPGDTVQITATYTFAPIVLAKWFPSGGYTYSVSATFKNEQFPPPAG